MRAVSVLQSCRFSIERAVLLTKYASNVHKFSTSTSSWSPLKAIASYFRGDTIRFSLAILNNCQEQVSNQLWHTRGAVPSDFRGKHSLLMLHIWMIHKRLILEGDQGKKIQECLFDQVWDDTCYRMRHFGVNEMFINKYLKETQGFSFKFVLDLDNALDLTTEDQVIDEIGGALWRAIYNRNENMNEQIVLDLAKYVRSEQQSILQLPIQAIYEGRVKWAKLPWQGKSKSKFVPIESSNNNPARELGEEGEEKDEEEKKEDEWKEAMAADGKVYYWNVRTRESRWTKP